MNYDTQTAVIMLALSGWVGAWLMWLVKAEAIPLLFSFLAPTAWLAGHEREEVRYMSFEDFSLFLCAESSAPFVIRKHLVCNYCLAASGSLFGLLVVWPSGIKTGEAIVVWATSAFFGRLLFKIV